MSKGNGSGSGQDIVLKMRDAGNVFQAIQQLPPVKDQKAAYTLGYLVHHLEPILRAFEKRHMALVAKYQISVEITDAAGKVTKSPPSIPPEKSEEFAREQDKLLDETITLPKHKLKFSDVMGSDKEGVEPKVTPSVIGRLIPILTED